MSAIVRPLNTSIRELTVYIRAHVNGVAIKQPRLVFERNALRQWNVQWIIVDKDVHPDIISRFENDPQFEEYSSTDYYLLFKNSDFGK